MPTHFFDPAVDCGLANPEKLYEMPKTYRSARRGNRSRLAKRSHGIALGYPQTQSTRVVMESAECDTRLD